MNEMPAFKFKIVNEIFDMFVGEDQKLSIQDD